MPNPAPESSFCVWFPSATESSLELLQCLPSGAGDVTAIRGIEFSIDFVSVYIYFIVIVIGFVKSILLLISNSSGSVHSLSLIPFLFSFGKVKGFTASTNC